MFGYKFISMKRFYELEEFERRNRAVLQLHRWFSGWKDLDVVWNYIMSDSKYTQIENVRSLYASKRGTDIYGNVKPRIFGVTKVVSQSKYDKLKYQFIALKKKLSRRALK